MASSATPYGLRPVKKVGGEPWNGAFNTYLIDPAGVANNIFNGSIVQLTANGYVELADGSGADITTNNFGGSGIGALGVFVGCEYVNAQGQVVHSQYYPTAYAAPTGTSIKAFVVDDPYVLFQAQFDGATGQADLGQGCNLTAAQNATTSGSTSTGNSNASLSATTAATVKCLKVVEFVSPASDTYADVLVKFTTDGHLLTQSTGV